MIKIFFLSIVIYFAMCNLNTIEFFNNGNYIVGPSDYHYSDNIIVEIWGAGSGGTVKCNKVACNINQFDYYSGNSGSYVKANIATNMETFNISIGKGGSSCNIIGDNYYKYYDCNGNINGGNSSFYNDKRTVEIISIGGNENDCNNIPIINIYDGYLLFSYKGNCGSNCIQTPAPNGYSGDYTLGYGGISCNNMISDGSDGGVRIYYADL